jgi:hypothetical protein
MTRLWVALPLLLVGVVAADPSDPSDPSDEAVAKARDAVARRLAVSEERVHLVDVTVRRWTDASLGCPRKGEVYAQVLTEGHRVKLRVDDRIFDVRVAGGRAMICEGADTAASQAAAVARLSRLARRDLATRLGVPEADVHVEVVRPSVWPDDRLGCAVEPVTGSPAAVRGFVLDLLAGGHRYEYRADAERVRFCERP